MNTKTRHALLIFTMFLFSLFLLPGSRAEAASVKIRLNKSSVTLYTNGTKTVKLKATVTGSKGKVTWSSSDKKVATVSSSGKVTAKKTGTAIITAKAGTKTAKCKVTVKKCPVKIRLNKSSATLYTNGTKTVKLKATVTGSKGKVTWSSSNKKVATVSSSGKVTAKKAGTATISAKVGGKTAKCKITVKNQIPARKLKIAVAYSASGDADSAKAALQYAGASVDIVQDCKVKDYDGLVIPGGVDIDPARYKAKNKGSVGINKNLDRLQFALIDKFVKAGKPVFGICRGLQLINVYFGGTLKQDIANHRGLYHATTIVKNSRLGKLYGSSLQVISYHHQAADKIGNGLKVTQRASDNNVEGLEHKTLPVMGVQWHPECMGSTGQIVLKEFLMICQQ